MRKQIEEMTKIAIFRRKEVHRTIHKNEWWFVIADIVSALTDTIDPQGYIKAMRRRDPELAKGWGQIATPLSIKTAGGNQKINCANTEGIFRLSLYSFMNNQVQFTIYDWLKKSPGVILSIIAILSFCLIVLYVRKTLAQVGKKEKEIFEVKDQIDNLESTLAKKSNGYVSQPQLDKLVTRDRKPLESKLEKLKMERQFLLDRISILGLIKK